MKLYIESNFGIKKNLNEIIAALKWRSGAKKKGLAFYHTSFCNCATIVAPICQCIL
jgi:hypothetical protein